MTRLTQITSDLYRETVKTARDTCGWCGQTKTGRWRGKLFQYLTVSPMGRQDYIRGLFCSVGCMRTYHS